MGIDITDLVRAASVLWENPRIGWDTRIAKITPCVDGILFEDVDGKTQYKWYASTGLISISSKKSWRKK